MFWSYIRWKCFEVWPHATPLISSSTPDGVISSSCNSFLHLPRHSATPFFFFIFFLFHFHSYFISYLFSNPWNIMLLSDFCKLFSSPRFFFCIFGSFFFLLNTRSKIISYFKKGVKHWFFMLELKSKSENGFAEEGELTRIWS